jgi:hypothetical protein
MLARAIDFVERWLVQHIPPQAHLATGGAKQLAGQLLLDAGVAGIPPHEIEEYYPELAFEISIALKAAAEGRPVVEAEDEQHLADLNVTDLPRMLETWRTEARARLEPFNHRAAHVEWGGKDVTRNMKRQLEQDLKRIEALLAFFRAGVP